MSDLVRTEKNGLITELTISRPEALNALNAEVLQGLERHLGALATAGNLYSETRLILIRGAGEKAFAAGADIKLMNETAVDPTPEKRARLSEFIELGQRVMRMIEDLPLPVIAVVHGFAIGGGLELALACDMIVASTEARLGQAEVNLGLIPGFGGSQRLIRRVGVGGAKRLILTGEPVSGSEALRIGLVDWAVPPAELPAAVEKICKSIVEKSPLAIASAKRLIDHSYLQTRDKRLRAEVEGFLDNFGSADAKEGIDAFISKRKPQFPGG